jgi:hypothetical protein
MNSNFEERFIGVFIFSFYHQMTSAIFTYEL